MFRAHADLNGRMSFAKFMDLALYHPEVGYYRKRRQRIGYAPGTDFFTATTSGPLFGELVAAACTRLLQTAGRDPREHAFIEIGAEPGSGGIMAGVGHGFRALKTLEVAQLPSLEGDCVVFSNELFDAQPCVRSVFRGGRWVEIGVEVRGETLAEVVLGSAPPCVPAVGTEGYHFDQPHAAAALAERLAAQHWRGLFVAFDYGKTFRELTEDTPAGT
ncbi:MAG: SAM-dependent methyltransferase, partial [Opitutaceae bacterium]